MAEKFDVCGVWFFVTIEDNPWLLCTRPPKHRGDHHCTVDLKWPKSNNLFDGKTMLTTHFRVDKRTQRLINGVWEKEPEVAGWRGGWFAGWGWKGPSSTGLTGSQALNARKALV